VAKHQLNHGGSVFMVQLENEHRPDWGTQITDPYLTHLDWKPVSAIQARRHWYDSPRTFIHVR
jgi:hypothetical protein